ncbi:DUF1471 domain-containing protein [Rahnella laticis]|uniref:DUF1471 domain-containing protein n=1 Tax=Rahnella laticis TaxID=2787622 RepID=UPI001E5E67C1|nr:DUF1471 domain-containing protein [Rahnella laticis]
MKKMILISALLCGFAMPAAFAATAPVTGAQEVSRSAVKMHEADMKGHMKVGQISGSASTGDDLEAKFASAATMMGAKYFVITSLNTDNHAYGTADFYN